MKSIILLAALTLAGCSTLTPQAHQQRVNTQRAHLPYLIRIGGTHSMSTVIPAGSTQMVRALPYDRLQSGMAVIFWPIGWGAPVCHFVGSRVGTDSWQTHGMNQASDLTTLGFLLTRENYIGVIRGN